MKRYLIGNRLVKASEVIKTTKKVEASEVEVKPDIIKDSDLDDLTVKELKAKAKELELEDYKSLKKGELIDLIESSLDESEL